MKTKFSLFVTAGMLLITGLFIGCAAPNEKTYRKLTQSYSKPKTSIEGGKLGILPFDCLVPSIGESISEATAVHLIEAGFDVIEYSQLSQILKKQDVNPTELVNMKDYARIASLSGVNYLLTGTIMIESRWRRRLYDSLASIVDANTGEVIVKVIFTPPHRLSKINIVGEALATGIKKELFAGQGSALD